MMSLTAFAASHPLPKRLTLTSQPCLLPTRTRFSRPLRLRLRRVTSPVFTPPKAHTSCHSPCQEHIPEDAPLPSNPVTTLLSRLADKRDSPRASIVSAILLGLAAAFHVARLPYLLSRIFLASCLALTGLPALADSCLRLIRSRGTAVGVDLLMTVAALVCVLTGALFEGALLATLYAVSHVAEDWTSVRARRALDALRDIAPTVALRLDKPTSSHVEKVDLSEIRRGDFVLVRSGEIIPCDGEVVSGSAFISMQHLTGEATPRHVEPGDVLPAGGKSEDAPVVIRVTEIGAESSMARISRLVTAAKENRPRISKFFDRFGQLYTRSVFLISLALAVFLPLITTVLSSHLPMIPFGGRSGSLARALGFLVVASPCTLVIGAPVAYLASLSACARRGVLAKSGAKSLEAASRVSHIIFDKTGTLTTGQLTLTSAVALPKEEAINDKNVDFLKSLELKSTSHLDRLQELDHEHLSRVVSVAAALERGAVHPIATAVQRKAEQLGSLLPDVSNAKITAGQGVEGILTFENNNAEDSEMAVGRMGRADYILNGATSLRAITNEASSRGETVSVLEIADDKYLLRMRDDVREESRQIVQHLLDEGLSISVLTGDGSGAAQYVSAAVGGGVEVISNATPQGKLEYVTKLQAKLQKKREGVLMVGDGVNDAAALAASLVGVSCGLSSATAVHASDVVLVHEDLTSIDWFLRKAKATKVIVLQNLIIALGLMVLSALACIGGCVPLWLAVTMHEGGTILVSLNGLRLLRER